MASKTELTLFTIFYEVKLHINKGYPTPQNGLIIPYKNNMET